MSYLRLVSFFLSCTCLSSSLFSAAPVTPDGIDGDDIALLFPNKGKRYRTMNINRHPATVSLDTIADFAAACIAFKSQDKKTIEISSLAQLARIACSPIGSYFRIQTIRNQHKDAKHTRRLLTTGECVNQVFKFYLFYELLRIYNNANKLVVYNKVQGVSNTLMGLEATSLTIAGLTKYFAQKPGEHLTLNSLIHVLSSCIARALVIYRYRSALSFGTQEQPQQEQDVVVTPEQTQPTDEDIVRALYRQMSNEQQTLALAIQRDTQQKIATSLQHYTQIVDALKKETMQRIAVVETWFEGEKSRLEKERDEAIAELEALYQEKIAQAAETAQGFHAQVDTEKEEALAIIQRESEQHITLIQQRRDEAIAATEQKTIALIAQAKQNKVDSVEKLRQAYEKALAELDTVLAKDLSTIETTKVSTIENYKNVAETDLENVASDKERAKKLVIERARTALEEYALEKNAAFQQVKNAHEKKVNGHSQHAENVVGEKKKKFTEEKENEERILARAIRNADSESAADMQKARDEMANAFAQLLGKPLTDREINSLLRQSIDPTGALS